MTLISSELFPGINLDIIFPARSLTSLLIKSEKIAIISTLDINENYGGVVKNLTFNISHDG